MPRRLENWITAYQEYTEETECAYLFNLWTGISSIASALQRKVWFNFGRLKICSNLFIIIVAEPGVARKTQAISFGEEIITEVPGIILAADSTTPAALLDDLESAEHESQFQDGTTMKHNSMTIVSGEFESFLGQKKDNARMVNLLTDFFDCKVRPFKYRTKHSGSNIINAICLNILAATTPESLASSLPHSAIGGGLTTRMIFLHSPGKEKKIDVPETSPRIEQLKKDLIHDLSIIQRITGGYSFSPEGREWWRHWYNNFDEMSKTRICKDPAFNGWYSRKPTFMLKISQIVAASQRDQRSIHPKDFEDSLALIETAEKGMGKTFTSIGRSAITAEIDMFISMVKQYRRISERLLMQIAFKDIDYGKLDNVARTAIKTGYVTRKYEKDEPGNIVYYWTDYMSAEDKEKK
jgi:hypothetical protein